MLHNNLTLYTCRQTQPSTKVKTWEVVKKIVTLSSTHRRNLKRHLDESTIQANHISLPLWSMHLLFTNNKLNKERSFHYPLNLVACSLFVCNLVQWQFTSLTKSHLQNHAASLEMHTCTSSKIPLLVLKCIHGLAPRPSPITDSCYQ